MSFTLVAIEVMGDLACAVFGTVAISIGINAGTEELMVVMAAAAAADGHPSCRGGKWLLENFGTADDDLGTALQYPPEADCSLQPI